MTKGIFEKKQNLTTSEIIDLIKRTSSGATGGGIKGIITLSSDFPVNPSSKDSYYINQDVTDNDPSKTNTGLSFKQGQLIIWNSTWLATKPSDADVVHITGNEEVSGIKTFVSHPKQKVYAAPTQDNEYAPKKYIDDAILLENLFDRSGTDLTPHTAGDNINLGTGGLKDSNVSTAIKLGDATNTSFNTDNKTIVGAVNEKANAVNGEPQGFQDAENEITLSFDDNTRTLTITKTGASYTFFSNGKKFIKTANESIVINNTQGNHFIYYDENGILQRTNAFSNDLIIKYCYVAYIYWNTTQQKALLGGQIETHGAKLGGTFHLQQHLTVGTRYQEGLGLDMNVDQDGSLLSHIQFSGSAGVIWDEDLKISILSKSLADNISIIYKLGAGADWYEDYTNSSIVKTSGTGRASYNQFTGGAWQLTEVSNGNYGIMYIASIPSITSAKRWVAIMGENEYATLNSVRDAAVIAPNFGNLPFQEIKIVGAIIFQTSNSYTNAVKSRIRSIDANTKYIDWRTTPAVASFTGASHNNLSGLQGGGAGEYYHLTQSKYNEVENLSANLNTKPTKPSSYTTGNLIKYNSATNQIEDAETSVQDLVDLENSYINLPAYQDFTNVVGTSLNLSINQNCFLEDGTPAPENITNNALIVSNSATATLTSDPSQYPRTSAFTSIKLIASIITASNTNQAITLSGIPRTADKDNIRIYFYIKCKRKDLPIQYNEFPKNVRINLQALDLEGIATDDELQTKISKDIANEINALTAKTTLLDGDIILGENSANSWSKIKTSMSNVLTYIKDKISTDLETTVTKYVNDLRGSDSNNGNSELKPYLTIEKAWTDITPSGQIKVLGASTYNVNHTFASNKSSIKTILEGGGKITGTISFVVGNTSMQFIDGKVQATINDASTGTQYWNNVDISGSTFNFTGGGYKQITNSSSSPTLINLANLASGSGILELNNIIGGIVSISVGIGWTVSYRNCLINIVGTQNGIVVDINNIYANSAITSQGNLNAILANASATTLGLYILNFDNPVISGLVVAKGDIIYKVATNTAALVYKFSFAPASISVINANNPLHRDVYIKNLDSWVIPPVVEDQIVDGVTTKAPSQNAVFDSLATKQNIDALGSDIASASTINLDTATGNTVNITGTTTITAITLSAGKRVAVRFTGILTLTNGASLILPTEANITTQVGDYAEFVGYSGGVVRCMDYQRADGTALAGSSATLVGLTDVNLSSIQDSQILKYDISSGKWLNKYGNEIITQVLTATGNINVNSDLVFADATSGNITITLPSASVKRQVHIIKINTTNSVIVNSAGGTINGQSSITITTKFIGYAFYSDGSNWFYFLFDGSNITGLNASNAFASGSGTIPVEFYPANLKSLNSLILSSNAYKIPAVNSGQTGYELVNVIRNLTTAQRDALNGQPIGFTIYNTTTSSYQIHIGENIWEELTKHLKISTLSSDTSNIASGDTVQQLADKVKTRFDVLIVDANGNLGVGQTTPIGRLDLTGSNSRLRFVLTNNYAYIVGNNPAGSSFADVVYDGKSHQWQIESVEKARIDSSGNLLINASSAAGQLTVVSSIATAIFGKSNGNSSSSYPLILRNSSDSNMFFVRSDGFIAAPLVYTNWTTGGAANLFIDLDGGFYRSTSSIKYKRDVKNATHGLKELLTLRPVTYKGKNKSDGDVVFGGLIAEEVHDAGLTEFVQYAKDGSPDALSYGNMVSLCVKAIQELTSIVNTQKLQIQNLELEMQNLKNKIGI